MFVGLFLIDIYRVVFAKDFPFRILFSFYIVLADCHWYRAQAPQVIS